MPEGDLVKVACDYSGELRYASVSRLSRPSSMSEGLATLAA